MVFTCSYLQLFRLGICILGKRQKRDTVKTASNLTGEELVWAVENCGQTLAWKTGRDLCLHLAGPKQLNDKTVVCSGVALSCKKKEKA